MWSCAGKTMISRQRTENTLVNFSNDAKEHDERTSSQD
jgi:hypothetical protein